jgi:hypothetical protein
MEDKNEAYMGLDEAVAFCGGCISKSRLRNMVYEGTLQAFKPGKRLMFRAADIKVAVEKFKKSVA